MIVGVRGGGRKRQGVLPELGSYMLSFTFSYYPLSAHSVHIHASVLKKRQFDRNRGKYIPIQHEWSIWRKEEGGSGRRGLYRTLFRWLPAKSGHGFHKLDMVMMF